MPITPDRSGNLPDAFQAGGRFHACPSCGMQGLYHLRPAIIDGEMVAHDRWRCRYCGFQTLFPPRASETTTRNTFVVSMVVDTSNDWTTEHLARYIQEELPAHVSKRTWLVVRDMTVSLKDPGEGKDDV